MTQTNNNDININDIENYFPCDSDESYNSNVSQKTFHYNENVNQQRTPQKSDKETNKDNNNSSAIKGGREKTKDSVKESECSKILANVTLSSSSNEPQIISGEEFNRHLQEDKFGKKPRITVVDNLNTNNNQYTFFNKKQFVNDNKDDCLDAFFITKTNNNTVNAPKSNYTNSNGSTSNNNPINYNRDFIEKRNYNNYYYNSNSNKDNNAKNNNFYNNHYQNKTEMIGQKRKRFSPLPKNKYRNTGNFKNLLIERVEKQVLTDICESYSDQEKFEINYYYISEIQKIINRQGAEAAIKYINKINDETLKSNLLNELTYYFKEIIKNEMDFASQHNGKLILIRKPPAQSTINNNKFDILNKNFKKFVSSSSSSSRNLNCSKNSDLNDFNRNPEIYRPLPNRQLMRNKNRNK